MKNEDFIRQCNISDVDMSIFFLSKNGYGSVNEIEQWDTPRFLDALEYEFIQTNIEKELYQREERKLKK